MSYLSDEEWERTGPLPQGDTGEKSLGRQYWGHPSICNPVTNRLVTLEKACGPTIAQLLEKEPDRETNLCNQKTLKTIESQSFLWRMIMILTLIQILILLFTLYEMLRHSRLSLTCDVEIIPNSHDRCEAEMTLNGIIYAK